MKANNWIKFSDQLPEIGTIVVVSDGKYMDFGSLHKNDEINISCGKPEYEVFSICGDFIYSLDEYQWWMPAPALPKKGT